MKARARSRHWSLIALLLVITFTLWAPQASFAEEFSSDGGSHFFDPAPHDQSLLYLSNIFGTVGTLLPGSPDMLLSTMMAVFNSAILALGIVFAAYTTLVGVMNTAGEGEMLGKKMNSIWTPLRLVIGITGLVPMSASSGYCAIQYLVMWMAIQGVGAADHMWTAAIDYIAEGNAIYSPATYALPSDNADNPSGNNDYDQFTKIMYEGLVCQQASFKRDPGTNDEPAMPLGSPNSADPATKYTYNFSYQGGNEGSVSCGAFEATDEGEPTMLDYINDGIDAIAPTLNAVAYYYVNYPDNTGTDRDQATYDFVGSSFLNNIESTYNSYLVQGATVISQAGARDDYSDSWDWARDEGWLTAGALFFTIAKQNNDFSESTMEAGQINAWATDPLASGGLPSSVKNYTTEAGAFIDSLIATRNSNTSGSDLSPGDSGSTQWMMGGLSAGIQSISTQFLSALNDGRNPIVSAQSLGHKILNTIEIIWTILLGTMVVMAALNGIFASIESTWLIFTSIVAFTLPIVLFVLGILGSFGLTLAVLIPMLPLVIFSLAAIGWLIVVIEGMIAAPLVMLGIMYPDGHDVWGKAEPAILILANMFARPMLMLLGLMAGLMMSWVGLDVVNYGLSTAISSMYGGGSMNAFETIGFLALYVGIYEAVLNKCFLLVQVIPDKVFRFLQGGEGAGSGQSMQEDMQKVSSGFQQGIQGAKEMGQSLGQAGQQMDQGLKGMGYEKRAASDRQAAARAAEKLAAAKAAENSGSSTGSGDTPAGSPTASQQDIQGGNSPSSSGMPPAAPPAAPPPGSGGGG